jgi:hypothetical protein
MYTASSPVSHDPHGVSPPPQLRLVPDRLANERTRLRSRSTHNVVVPPVTFASYGRARDGSTAGPSPRFISWLRTRMVMPSGPGNAPMPSCSPGVGSPFESSDGCRAPSRCEVSAPGESRR